MLRLFTTLYPEKNPTRRAEYAECQRRNLECAEIDEVCLLVEGDGVELPDSTKIRVRKITSRPTYEDFFEWIRELAGQEDVSVVANTDIWFDGELALFRNWRLPDRTVFALSRWDLNSDGESRLYDHNDSQDSWIVRGAVGRVAGNFPLGVPRCDNRIAAEFEKAGYKVRNPSFSLKSYHLHDAPARNYDLGTPYQLISPPYKYVWPHNLFGAGRIAIYNLVHPESSLGYRLDKRRLAKTLPLRLMRKLGSIISGNQGKSV